MRPLTRAAVISLICGLSLLSHAQAADVAQLVNALKSTDTDQRRSAARELADLGGEAKAAAPALIEAMTTDSDLFVRRFAAQAVGKVGADPKVAVPALTALLNDKHKELNEAAVEALGRMGAPAVPALSEALKGGAGPRRVRPGQNVPDGSALVRSKAAAALGRIGPDAKAAVPALVEALKDNSIRTDAATALGEIGGAAKDALPALEAAVAERGVQRDAAYFRALNTAIRKIKAKS